MIFLYYLVISPIEAIVDWVFLFVINKVESVGVMGAVFAVSLAINFLALPLYNIADSLQEKERNLAKSMEAGIKRIKKAFKGDEQFMMLQTFYRQHHYHPIYAFRSSLSILIEIPFFIAAYQYLSHNPILQGASWWIFKDLGSPDTFVSVRLFSVDFPIHILPILMTLINFVSGAIYSKEAPLREKVQLYGIAVVFLALLYNSPSGLVLYWILNNIFSLCKNIAMKTRNPGKIAHMIISFVFCLLAAYVLLTHGAFLKKIAIVLFSSFVAALPFLKKMLKRKVGVQTFSLSTSANTAITVSSGLCLALLFGWFLPSRVIASSPVEFSFLGTTDSPVSYIWSSLFVFLGCFLFWPLVISKLFGKKLGTIIPFVLFLLFVCSLTNAIVFNVPSSNLSVSFTLENEKVLKHMPPSFFLLPLLVVGASSLLFCFLLRFRRTSVLTGFLFSIALAEFAFGIVKYTIIEEGFKKHSLNIAKYLDSKKTDTGEIKKIYNLSLTENNVIVLFLDRAISSFFPRFLSQFPEFEKSFDGFTYYPNTVSFSTNTSLGAPAMMGGYEYSPIEINKREGELLRDKHNESMLVLPKFFADAGYHCVVTDPPWSNYAHEGDLSPFEGVENIDAYSTFGKYTDVYFDIIGIKGGVETDRANDVCRKEIRNFSVLQVLYPPVRSTFYRLCRENSVRDDRTYYDIFSSLYFLDKQTSFESESPTYCFIDNDTPHEPHAMGEDFLTVTNKKKSREETHYDSNAASLLQVGKYLDYLKKNDAYDNTRIIIVADHGQDLSLDAFKNFGDPKLPARYNPLFLVKDFNARGALKIDCAFMTNADTPYIATKNLGLDQVNPFTHEPLLPRKENGVDVFPISNGEHHADHLVKKFKFTLDEERAFHVEKNLFEEENWTPLKKFESEKNK